MRIKLELTYDGTNYCGWARQKDLPTIQAIIEDALADFHQEPIDIWGASRTDSGVHALAQTCHFDTNKAIPPEKWRQILNDRLPSDIVCKKSTLVSDQFESRFSAQHRKYRYCLYYGEPSPFRNRFAHYLGPFFKLDLLQMQAAAQILIGEHDFRHLSRKDPAVQNTVRKLYSIDVTHHRNREIHIDITGTAFIRGMMRRIAGALMEVGLGHLSMQEFQNLLSPTLSPDTHLPVVLPACGLILIKVTYGRHPKDFRLTKI